VIWFALFVVALLGAWEAYVALSGVSDIVLPPPSDVLRAFADEPGLLWDNFQTTAVEVAGGIVVALVAGAGLAIVLHLFDRARRAVFPLLVASQAVPIVVLAPLLVVWLGFSIAPKLVIIGIVCFFPVVVTTLDALKRADREQVKVLRSLGASNAQVLRWVELPTALPAALSGAKVAVAVAVIGAVLAEDAGAESGLGLMITQANAQFDIALSFAAVGVLAALALTLYFTLQTAERRIAPWAHDPHGGPTT
jgi:NitT/TauT family transport system permease protein/putative hydroxymethylpyrimidine transport system permease protein